MTIKRTLLLIATTCILAGCGQYGTPLLLASWYDSSDPCQSKNWPENGGSMNMDAWGPRGASGYPQFCGGGGPRRTTIYTMDGRPAGYTR